MAGNAARDNSKAASSESARSCSPPRHVGPVQIVRYWGKGGKYRARRCEHCGLEWRERVLRFGRRGTQYWQRSITSVKDLEQP